MNENYDTTYFSKSQHEIPWLFPDINPFSEFPWHYFKFPDNSLTLKKLIFPWLFPDTWQPCHLLHHLSHPVKVCFIHSAIQSHGQSVTAPLKSSSQGVIHPAIQSQSISYCPTHVIRSESFIRPSIQSHRYLISHFTTQVILSRSHSLTQPTTESFTQPSSHNQSVTAPHASFGQSHSSPIHPVTRSFNLSLHHSSHPVKAWFIHPAIQSHGYSVTAPHKSSSQGAIHPANKSHSQWISHWTTQVI